MNDPCECKGEREGESRLVRSDIEWVRRSGRGPASGAHLQHEGAQLVGRQRDQGRHLALQVRQHRAQLARLHARALVALRTARVTGPVELWTLPTLTDRTIGPSS